MWSAILGEGSGRAEREAAFVRDTPLRRFGTRRWRMRSCTSPHENAYTTGAEFVLDGGLLAGSAATPGAAEH
jgi:3(or 17)beta-hydroxysteroid dehydrogenase